ncbi:MAG: hypothetical protein OXI16_02315 [Chloroflexota bacterium]|nr:hypothetical protein [Chloroflexota bacterium]
MGYELSSWAQTLEHPCLTPRTRQVLSAICMVAHDDHGEFWMRGKKLIEEYLPDMSYGGYRNCLGRLVRNGLLIKIEHGGGRTSSGRGTTTRYRVNSPVVRNPHPAQGVLPEIARSPDAPARPSEPEVGDERLHVSADDVHRRVDELLAVGITPERMMAFLEAASETMTGSGNMSQSGKETCHDPEKHVTDHDRFPQNTSRIVTGFGRETRHDSEKHVTDHDRFPTNMSQIMTSPQIHEEKIHEDKEEAVAAGNPSRSEHRPPDFFELLAGSLGEAGHGGIMAAQFSDLRGLAARYEKLTGSPPDERTAGYIAGRVRDSRGVRNVVGFARRITQDVLTTGEGFVTGLAREPPPESLPGPSRENDFAREPSDWDLLHLAHVEQVYPAEEVWASVLEVLRSQVPRPAFETWLAGSRGVAYAGGQFVVSVPSRFAAEMLEARLHPLIQRALRDAVGAELAIQYTVAPRRDESCPHCQARDTQAEAS